MQSLDLHGKMRICVNFMLALVRIAGYKEGRGNDFIAHSQSARIDAILQNIR